MVFSILEVEKTTSQLAFTQPKFVKYLFCANNQKEQKRGLR
jgi:hypothetical protein